MEVNEKLVREVAAIARLELTDKEVKAFVPELQEVLASFSCLDEVNTEGVTPSFHPVEQKNVMREDEPGKCLSQEEALSLAHHKKDGYFMGPKVIE